MSVTSVNSQNWLQNRQQWTYSVGGGFSNPSDGLHTLSITGDTTIANKDCKILTNLFLGDPSYQPKSYFVYTEEEAVYSYDFSENDFIKMYDFSMAVGDSVVFTNNKKYKVDSIGTMEINNRDFRFQQISFFNFSPGNLGWTGPYHIVEEMGFVGWLTDYTYPNCSYFLIHNILCNAGLDGQNYRLTCYNSDNFTYDPYNNCQTTSTNEITTSSFKLYPNPSSSFFKIEFPNGIKAKHVVLYDLLGRTVYSDEIQDAKISVANLPAQTYFVKIKDESGVEYFSRIVVSK